MYYNLKESSNEILLWAIDVIIMRKAQYSGYLSVIESGVDVSEFKYIHESLWYEDGMTLKDFDDQIESIQNELDKDYRYE